MAEIAGTGPRSDFTVAALPILALGLAGIGIRYAVYWLTFSDASFANYVEALCVWDCRWYSDIATRGYMSEPSRDLRGGMTDWAYFPLYPLLVSLVHSLTGIPVIVAGFIVSNIAIVGAAYATKPLFAENHRAYWLFVFLLLAGPFAFLFSTLYTESLFILLTILGLSALGRGRYVLAGFWTALLSATRVTGILFVFAILAEAIDAHLKSGKRWATLVPALLRNQRLVLAGMVAPLGLVAYMVYLRILSGDGFAFVHVQRAWGRSIGNPFEKWWIAAMQYPTSPDAMVGFTWAWATAVAGGLCMALFWQRRIPAGVFCAVCLLVSLSAGVGSMLRFAAGLAPLGIAAADLLSRWTPLYYLAYPISAAAGAVIAVGWFRQSFLVM